jgi:hypothetical protein
VRPIFALAVFVACIGAAPLAAQHGVQLDVKLAPANSPPDGAIISTANLLADSKTQELLVNGFSTGITYRLELWRKGGWSYEQAGKIDWTVLVSYDPRTHLYSVVRNMGSRSHESFGAFPSVSAAEAQFDQPFQVPLKPTRAGRYYYNLVVDVQTLTESDLDALQQWVRGSSGPRRSNPFRALVSGVGTLVSRLLGGDKRHYEQRSDEFTVP